MIIESETKPVIIRNQSLNGKLFIIIFEKFENSLLSRVEWWDHLEINWTWKLSLIDSSKQINITLDIS